ncbi:hypothetical protein D8682_25310 [Buttiauxella sp. 3AFRM03]|uniref:phage major tail tube protein n=1 Tax=Buttiauxella sp. 3AFRM03 TaxID=2479367 RepID=UPI000EF79E3A|nr:phage major tail tube protein [Buttiauxella sp. 3AFRM03]AYN30004.1 hypothetical protein D8682_25310 [Buttiauxella sp. 3AFRM03]
MPVYRGCSLWMNGLEIADTVSYTPPEIKITQKLFKAGAMNAPVPVDDGTELMTASYKCQGMDAMAFMVFGIIPGVRARLSVRRAYRGPLEDITMIEEEVEGFVSAIRADEHGNNDKDTIGQIVTVSASYYRVSANGVYPLLEINPVLGLRKILGINVLGMPGNFMSLIL